MTSFLEHGVIHTGKTAFLYQNRTQGPYFNIKILSLWFGQLHVKGKTADRTSCLQHGVAHTGKTASLH